MFIDKIRVDLIAGKGGDGAVRFDIKRKPSGGNGGNGGSIYLQGTTNLHDLSYFKENSVLKAQDAKPGEREQRKGRSGEDLIIKVPLITKVLGLDNKEIIKVTKKNEKVLIVKGGRGGIGNHYYRRSQLSTLHKFTPGDPGEELQVFFELRLLADVVFIGLPNAGKSSMLNTLTNSDAKVASYPFTTLQPNVAVAGGLVLMDLPGLIEGTIKGKGLGTRFMKHATKTKLVAHFISLESDDLLRDYRLIRKELREIDKKLSNKEELIVLSKSDMLSDSEIDEGIRIMKKENPNVIDVSILKDKSVTQLLEKFKEYSKP